MLDNQLKLAPAFVQGYAAAQTYGIAVFGGELQPLIAILKHRTAHLGVAVLEGEVPVSRRRRGKVADLTFYPDEVKVAFQQRLCLPVELADGE
jgi:hypothetical protein